MREWEVDLGPRRLRLAVCGWGPTDGRPILVLHGFLEQGAAWDAVAQRLPGRVVAPDQRGHGRSEHVGRGGFYHFWDYVADVDALVQILGGGPVDLVGHSMGGTVACLFAGCRPDRVRRLVLVEGLGPPDATEHAVQRGRRFLDDLREGGPRHPPLAGLPDAIARLRRHNPALDEITATRLAERLVVDGNWSWDALHRARSPVPFDATTFQAFLREITAPTLLVDGARSRFRVPDAPERAACLRDRRHVVLSDAGHLVHHDQPDALARAITEHLTG